MFICGYNFCGGENACAFTPTSIEDITDVAITHGVYDDLYITKNVDDEYTDSPPEDWDYDTILYAKFNGNTNAGNADLNTENVSDLIIKRRKVGEFKWQTIIAKQIKTIDDFDINFNDYLVPNGQETEYAVVPVLYGQEGHYSSTTIVPSFGNMFLIEGDTVYGTPITDGFCDTTRNIPSSNVELLNSKYPVFVRNTIANYDTGTISGSFVPVDPENSCDMLLDKADDYTRIRYQKEVMDFICDGNPKVLKLPDGRAWIVQVTPSPTDTADSVYNNRKISFSFVEIGDLESEEDLYALGLSDVSEEWWNR